jgi:hypothetical protein
MNRLSPRPPLSRGVSLIETVIAMGVLAVVIPLVFGAIAESGRSGISAEADTRCAWIVPQCVEEIRLSRESKGSYNTVPGQAFPAAGDVWALAFSPEGKLLGKLGKEAYEKSGGVRDFQGEPVAYLATLSATGPAAADPAKPGAANMLTARITVEYPSGVPMAKRQKLEFYTSLP